MHSDICSPVSIDLADNIVGVHRICELMTILILSLVFACIVLNNLVISYKINDS